jgi:competence protein ComEA
MAQRLALLAVALATLAAAPFRVFLERPPPPRACDPEGRGVPPRHWLGCATDPGPRRELEPEEALALGRPIDLNRASARDLAFVPGLSRALAGAVVADRARNGPFRSVEDLARVRGVGPKRLARARSSLVVR